MTSDMTGGADADARTAGRFGSLGRAHGRAARGGGRFGFAPRSRRSKGDPDRATTILARRRRRARTETGTPHREPVADRIVGAYQALCYRLVGERLDQREDRHLGDRLRQADVAHSAGMFRAVQGTTTLIAAGGAYGLLAALFFAMDLPLSFVWSAALAGIAGASTFAAFPMAVTNRISNRRRAIDRDLPFTLSELSVLASIGLSPIELLRRMAARTHDPAMTDEFRKVVHKTDIQGKDLITALAETAKQSPSEALRETLWDLGNMIHQGGDLGTYLQQQSSEILDLKRVQQKGFIDQLTTYADAYVTIVLIGVIFVAIGAFLLDAFGKTAGGLSANALLTLLTYGLMPCIVIIVGILLSSAYQAHE